jgi:hypothetical protein
VLRVQLLRVDIGLLVVTREFGRSHRGSGPRFEVQGANFGPLGSVLVLLVNALGEEVSATGVVAGPAATDPGATESVLATAPPSLGGNEEQCTIVLVGSNGTSAETASALFAYT